VPVLDVNQRYSGVELKRKGEELWGCSPFRNEKTPSFSCNPEKNLWFDFGCGVGGGSVAFVMKLHNIPFHEAALMVERDFNISNDWQAQPR